MKKIIIVAIIILIFLVVGFSSLTYRWKAETGLRPVWSRYIPQTMICHLGGIPPAGGSHCHDVWETPHSHPQ